EGFNAGTFPFLVTSRVLNEGVDVPAANVAIVLSGTGSVREHVQRLGRILRRGPEKRAILYELIAEDTAEESTSARRRQHSAYSWSRARDGPSRPCAALLRRSTGRGDARARRAAHRDVRGRRGPTALRDPGRAR